jgi:hypothetical protein
MPLGHFWNLLVNISGYNVKLNWTISSERLNVLTNTGHPFIHRVNKECASKIRKQFMRENTRINQQSWTNVKWRWLCIVTGGALSIDEFYNKLIQYYWKLCLSKLGASPALKVLLPNLLVKLQNLLPVKEKKNFSPNRKRKLCKN